MLSLVIRRPGMGMPSHLCALLYAGSVVPVASLRAHGKGWRHAGTGWDVADLGMGTGRTRGGGR
jgi:hypothetical protein